MVRCIVRTCLCVSEDAAVVEGDLQLDVLAMEVVLQAVEIAGTLSCASIHWRHSMVRRRMSSTVYCPVMMIYIPVRHPMGPT